MHPLGDVLKIDRLLFVGLEHFAQLLGRSLTIEEDVRLEIVLKTADVDIRGTAGTDGVVADEEFRMEEAGPIEHDGYHRKNN